MNILQINNTDLPGRRFNGHDMQIYLNKKGIKSRQIVFDKLGNDPNTIEISSSIDRRLIRNSFIEFETNLSMQSLVYPYGWRIMSHDAFKEADVVHYHLMHNFFMSLFTYVDLVNMKPSIWTLHDPWAFTGHCIYPMTCEKWKTGCFDCEALDTHFTMKADKASQMWKLKKELYAKMNVDIVVASKYMLGLLKESPLTTHFNNVHIIPFGIDLDLFKDLGKRNDNRKTLGIPENNFVISFRSDPSKFKGLNYIKEMLDMLKPTMPVTIVTVGMEGLLEKYKGKYNIVEYGWVHDDSKMARIYSVSDVFLMPSTAEAFGLMAIEAMASSRPVIVMDGTSLPEVTFVPECGILVKQGDCKGFTEAVERLMANPQECDYRGKLGRELAEEHYDVNVYFSRFVKLYEDVSARDINK